MQPTYSAEAEAYREKVQAFLAEKLPSNWEGIGALDTDDAIAFTEEWRRTLYEANYLAPGWPVEYGGAGLTATEQVILAEEFAKAGVPSGGPNDVFGIQMLGNTLLLWGSEEQKKHYLPRILSGEDLLDGRVLDQADGRIDHVDGCIVAVAHRPADGVVSADIGNVDKIGSDVEHRAVV